MDKKTRLKKAFDLEQPDRPPILGGWLAAPGYIQALTGCSEDEYWADPFRWGLEAERVLGSDGVIGIFEPIGRGEYRCVDGQVLRERAAHTLEGIVAWIEALPDPKEVETNFALARLTDLPETLGETIPFIDEASAYAEYAAHLRAKQAQCGDILWCPADWWVIPKALWYHEFGHENGLMLPALYPDHWRKLFRLSAVRARQRATLEARAVREGLLPRAMLTGEDLCSQQGPMVSPDFLRREYFPWVEYAIEPLLAIGSRLVWHSDGNVRPIFDDVLACGFAGFQGFQRECGVDIEWIVERRTRNGEPLLIFGPLSVTTTLPFGSPEDVRAEARRAMRACRDRASLVFFTSNTINPDVPLENIKAYWRAALESAWSG